jgi:cytochrome b6-f complex iron-sulfur subunit
MGRRRKKKVKDSPQEVWPATQTTPSKKVQEGDAVQEIPPEPDPSAKEEIRSSPSLRSPEAGAGRIEPASRRRFIGSGLVLGACGLSALAGGLRFAMPLGGVEGNFRFALGRLSDFKMNTLTWLRDRDLFVLRSQDGVGAFSAKCTHLGCTVRRTDRGFVCPCHGATYGQRGDVLTGPARSDLPWFETWFESDGYLWVNCLVTLDRGGPVPISLPRGPEE